jgi:hypothetical protein
MGLFIIFRYLFSLLKGGGGHKVFFFIFGYFWLPRSFFVICLLLKGEGGHGIFSIFCNLERGKEHGLFCFLERNYNYGGFGNKTDTKEHN